MSDIKQLKQTAHSKNNIKRLGMPNIATNKFSKPKVTMLTGKLFLTFTTC